MFFLSLSITSPLLAFSLFDGVINQLADWLSDWQAMARVFCSVQEAAQTAESTTPQEQGQCLIIKTTSAIKIIRLDWLLFIMFNVVKRSRCLIYTVIKS